MAAAPEGVTEQDFTIGRRFFSDMENTDVLDSDVKVHLRLEHKNDAYYCRFTLKGAMLIPCDRCLDPMEHPVDTALDIVVKYGYEYDDSSDDVLVLPQSEAFFDASGLLYDTLILTVPMRHVHPQGACNPAMTEALQAHGGDAADPPAE